MKHQIHILTILLSLHTQKAMADQVSEFDVIVNKCKSAIIARPLVTVSRNEKQKVWVKKSYAPSLVAYDVVRTNSLVTPLSGFIEITEIVAFSSAEAEASAEALNVSFDDVTVPSFNFITRIEYLYKSNGWIASGIQKKTFFKLKGEKSFNLKDPNIIKYGSENLPDLSPPLNACLQK